MTLMIGLAGGVGAICRYLLDKNFMTGTVFPASTFLINGLGSFLIGFVFVLGAERNLISRDMALILSTGFLGGFTTFSAYALQTLQLSKSGNLTLASIYFISSPILALVAAFLGLTLARLFA